MFKETEWIILPNTKEGYKNRIEKAKVITAKEKIHYRLYDNYKDEIENVKKEWLQNYNKLDGNMNNMLNHLGDTFTFEYEKVELHPSIQ